MKAKDLWKLDVARAREKEQLEHTIMMCNLLADDIYPLDFRYDEISADYWLDEIDWG